MSLMLPCLPDSLQNSGETAWCLGRAQHLESGALGLSSGLITNSSYDPGKSFLGLCFPTGKTRGQDWVTFKVL